MDHIKTAVEQRENQLKRQIKAQTNPMIKQLLETEMKDLDKQYEAYRAYASTMQPAKK